MTKDEALKLALEGAANYIDVLGGDSKKYRQALEEALAQPKEQEPVAWIYRSTGALFDICPNDADEGEFVPLYTTPPQHKPLTDEMVVAAARVLNERQADACGVDRDDQWAIYSNDFKADARAMLEAAHGIKGD